MAHNRQPASNHEFTLPGHRVLALEGRDAAAFAQAQFMNDVAGLNVGHWQWSGWLTPKGRLIALFALLKLDEQMLWLLLPDADPAEFAAALQRFVFRSKVKLESCGDLIVSGSFSIPTQASASQVAGDAGNGIELDMGGDGGPRGLRIGANSTASLSPDEASRWAAFDLEHGLPRLPPAQAGQWTPQQLSLDRLRAFSVKKGCYPGQEIVARTHFLGQAKRGLALLEADGAIAVGSNVRDGERALGTIVSASGDRALAVLPLQRDAAALNIDDIALREIPLLGGLAR
ncbi:MAG TPA: folate-binding protein [Luteimonas sp.]|nr:folate-binding protein [Luteimonas sp.]